jgi:hypothetical protein
MTPILTFSSDTPTHDAAISGSKISPLDSETKGSTAGDGFSSTGDSGVLGKTHIEPLADEHTSKLDSGIGGTEGTNKAKTVADTVTETIQSAATTAGQFASDAAQQVKTAINDATSDKK